MWKKSLALLIAVLMLTQVCAFASYSETFDGYTADAALDGQNGWTASSQFTVVTDPVNEGNSLVAKATGTGISATKTFEAQSGNMVDVSFRFMLKGKTEDGKAAGNLFSIKDGDKTIATLANVILQGTPGNYADGTAAAKWNPAVFTMAANTSFSTNNLGNMSANNFYKMVEWVWLTDKGTEVNKGGVACNVWFYVRMKVNFETKMVDTYVSKTAPVTDEMIASNTDIYGKTLNVPFIDQTAEKVDTFNYRRPSGISTDVAFDDLSVAGEGAPAPAVTVEGTGVSAQADDTQATLRFACAVTGDGATGAGAAVLPLWIFEDQGNLDSAETVAVNQAIANGQTFGIDVTNIPAAQFGTVVVVKPYVMAGDAQVWAQATAQSSVNDILK